MNELLNSPSDEKETKLLIPEFLQANFNSVVTVINDNTQILYNNVRVYASALYSTNYKPCYVFNQLVFDEYVDNNSAYKLWQTGWNPSTTTFEIEFLDKKKRILQYYEMDKVRYQNDGRYFKTWGIVDASTNKIIDEHNDGSVNNPKYNELTRYKVKNEIPSYFYRFTFSNITRSLGINRLRLYGYEI